MIKDFVCSAPWQGMFINPDGDFRVCCAGKSLGNLNKKSVIEIINDTPIKSVRNDILTKGHSEYCTNCMEMEEKQGHSLRNQFKQNLNEFDSTVYNPTITDIRWRNTCHLRCVYCNSEWSSAYALWEKNNARVSETNWQQDVLNFLGEHKRNFITVNLLGGEPLLLKENLDFIKMIDPSIRLSLVTNLSVDGVEELPVYKELLNRPCGWLVSLETTNKKFEYIRRNAKWEITKKNYENLNLKNSPYHSNKGIHMTYCIYSAFSLVETFDWIREIEPDSKQNFNHITVLLGPSMFCIYNFPPEVKQAAIAEIDRLIINHGDYLTKVQLSIIQNLRQSLIDKMNYVEQQSIKDFKNHVIQSDIEMFPIKFADEWPELNSLLFEEEDIYEELYKD